MLQFMKPAVAARDAIRKNGLTGRDEARRHATAPSRDRGTHQHRLNLCSSRTFGSPCDNPGTLFCRASRLPGRTLWFLISNQSAVLTSLPRLFSFRSMAVETLGGMAARVEAHRAVRLRQSGRDEIDPHLHLPGAAGHADAGLDARPNFPLSRLESRLMCPECGSRRVSLLFDVPKLPVAASAKRVTER